MYSTGVRYECGRGGKRVAEDEEWRLSTCNSSVSLHGVHRLLAYAFTVVGGDELHAAVADAHKSRDKNWKLWHGTKLSRCKPDYRHQSFVLQPWLHSSLVVAGCWCLGHVERTDHLLSNQIRLSSAHLSFSARVTSLITFPWYSIFLTAKNISDNDVRHCASIKIKHAASHYRNAFREDTLDIHSSAGKCFPTVSMRWRILIIDCVYTS